MSEKNATKNVTITDGVGTSNIVNGNYSVTSATPGYNNASLSPASVTVSAGVTVYNFTIEATGSLELHVTETGTADGTPVQNAVFYRCDNTGKGYGTFVKTNASGVAVLNNVPFSADGSSTVYFKQTASDPSHEYDNTLKSVKLTAASQTVEISNPLAELRTINLTDGNYSGMPIKTSTLTFDN